MRKGGIISTVDPITRAITQTGYRGKDSTVPALVPGQEYNPIYLATNFDIVPVALIISDGFVCPDTGSGGGDVQVGTIEELRIP